MFNLFNNGETDTNFTLYFFSDDKGFALMLSFSNKIRSVPKCGSSTTEGSGNIRSTYGNEVLSVRICQRWLGQFQTRNFSLEYSFRPTRPVFVSIEFLQAAIEENPKQIAWELAKQFNTVALRSLNTELCQNLFNGSLILWLFLNLYPACPWTVDLILNVSWLESSSIMKNTFSIIISNENDNG